MAGRPRTCPSLGALCGGDDKGAQAWGLGPGEGARRSKGWAGAPRMCTLPGATARVVGCCSVGALGRA
eukprot:340284-Chlamydomonas_euryale.AAC.1